MSACRSRDTSFGTVSRLRDELPMCWGMGLNRNKILLYSSEPPWCTCTASTVAGARSWPYLHLSPGVENAWTSGSTTSYIYNVRCLLTTRTAFPVHLLCLFCLFCFLALVYPNWSAVWLFLSCPPQTPRINIPVALPSSFQATKRLNVLSYCNGLSTATCGTHCREENLILRFGGNTWRKELLGRRWRRWEDNVKVDLEEVGCKSVN